MVLRMSWTDAIGSWFRGLAGRWQAPATSTPSAPPREDYPSSTGTVDWDDQQWLEQANKSAVLAIPLSRLEDDVASVRWHLWRKGPPGPDGRPTRVEVMEHPLLDLWKRPNPLMLGRIWRQLWVRYYEVNGRILVRVVYGPDGRTPEKLWILPPGDLLQRCDLSSPDPRKRLWKIRWQKKPLDLEPREVLLITRPDPNDPYGLGVGAALAVKDEVMQVSFMNRWSSNFFRLGAHIGKILGIPGLNENNKKAIQASFNTDHTGVDNSHKTLFVALEKGAGTISVVQAGPTQKELDFVQGQTFLQKRIRQRWGIPPEVVGDVDNSNRATAEASDYIHQSKNVRPRLTLMADYINTFITPMFAAAPGELVLEPEEPVKETAEQRHKEADDAWRSGAICRNVYLAAHGLDPLPEPLGSQFLVPANMLIVNADGTIVSTKVDLTAPNAPPTEEAPQ